MNDIEVILVDNDEKYQKCLDIRKKVFIEEQKVPCELEIEYEKESTHFLVLKNGIPVATGRFRIKDTYLKFERIATIKEERGQGIGRILMKEMQKRGYEKYPFYLQVTNAQKQVIPFYESLKWVRAGDIFLEANIEHVMMINPPKNLKELRQLKCLKDPKTSFAVLQFLNNLENNFKKR